MHVQWTGSWITPTWSHDPDGLCNMATWVPLDRWLRWERWYRGCLLEAAKRGHTWAQRLLWTRYRCRLIQSDAGLRA